MARLNNLIYSLVSLVLLHHNNAFAQEWKHYPLVAEDDPSITFPYIEGIQYQDMGDAWFMTTQVTGETTGKKYQTVNIFNRNYITAVILNFYQVSIFDLETGEFVTYTDYDLPGISLLDMKFRANPGSLDVAFDSPSGNATWDTLSPFAYHLSCPGNDHITNEPFAFNLTANFTKEPVIYGAAALHGQFEFFGQKNTTSYFIVRPQVAGTVTMHGITERVTGSIGHLDRQIFPLYSGIYTPTGRQHSHEWRQINFLSPDETDLAIWRQFDRTNNNTLLPTSGVTASPPGDASDPIWTDAFPDDLTVEYITYAKYPRSNFSTLVPPPSLNMWMPADHIIRSSTLNMTLQCTYITPAPAATLPIEYFEGPAIWNGTYQGREVNAVGIFESSLALYRDWELAKVLLDSVEHLSVQSFSAGMPKGKVVEVVSGVNAFVSSNPLQDNRAGAASYIQSKLMPALQTMEAGSDKEKMLEIADDLNSSLSLVLEF